MRENTGRSVITTATYEARAAGVHSGVGVMKTAQLAKILSKICFDLEKPDGINIIGLSDIPDRIWLLYVREIHGLSPKATEKLLILGITTIADLARTELSFLQTHFSRSYSLWLYEASHGIDNRLVITNSKPKSISRETTLEQDCIPGMTVLLYRRFSLHCARA